MKNYDMKSAKTTWKRAVKVKPETDATLRKNKWTAYTYKTNDTFERYMQTLERRFTYTTYNELKPKLMNRLIRSLDKQDCDVLGRPQYNDIHRCSRRIMERCRRTSLLP